MTNNEVPQTPDQPEPLQTNQEDQQELMSARKFVLAASILGPVSLIIGGMFLDFVALFCGFHALRKLNRLIANKSELTPLALRLKRSCIVALVVCGIATVLNLIGVIIMYPIILEAVQTGNYSGLFNESSAGNTNTTWG